MATITSLGIGSGLDLNGLLDQLKDAERGKLAPITRQQEQQNAKISAYGKIQSSLDGFKDAVDGLNDPQLYQSLSANVRGDEITTTTSAEALPGSYRVEVTQLATSGTLASSKVTDASEPLTLNGATQVELNFGADGTASSVKVDIAADSSLEDIRDAINANKDAGVSASVIFDGTDYRLALSSNETGVDASVHSFSFLDGAGAAAAVDTAEGTALTSGTAIGGQDAALTVNGIAITSENNQVEGAIQGVTLNLGGLNIGVGETASSTVTVERNTLKIREAVGGFVKAFNDMKETIGTLTKYSGDRETAGELVGDSTVRTIEGRLRSALTNGVAGGEFSTLSQLGITLQRDGTLEIDEDTISDLAKNNPDALGDFFAGVEDENGLADALSTTTAQLTGNNGTLGIAISGAENRIESLNARYERMEQSIDRTISRYRVQFGQLDAMIAQMNQTSSYLTQQFDALDMALGRKK
ncbi:flagellar filament capping protein FliD [Halomonas llamarensis]|uniref:Flagellar hook-associated protein 2 n=1 Tax=Halomonas llamarensis TaxID=2945104 RepID=A0ABT0SLW8_9GAMM|nr:flagellar filament capping protein FliD [Halomonas llamarensis]MCL7928573.1 flagellar filament capping protein FliD [Halomonas llamarensis]